MSRSLFPETDLYRALRQAGDDPPRVRPGSGGKVFVPIADVIAGDNCWCGRPQNHDWPMKAEGAPHPRYPE